VVITLLALPELTLAETAETCLGSSISLIVSSDENILWSPTNLISISNQSETEFIGTESGFVYVQVTNDFGCQDIDSIYITVNSVPNVDYSANILEGCAPHQVNFMDNSVSAGDNPIIDWQWHFYESNTEVNNQQNPTIEFEGNFSDGSTTDSISVMLVVTNQAGCADTLAVTNQVIIHENPEAFFSLFPRVTNLNDSRIKFTDLSSGAPVIWNWEFGNGNGSTLQDPVFQYEEDGIYTVILTIETADGCVSTITDSVIIKPIFSFYIPNSFTPNNDDVNDSFGGYGIGIADYEMTILNRWGEEIFYSANSAEFWNGTYKGKQVEGATYAYKFTIVDINGETHRYLGAITLIR
jgi:gliding motility-associated-like protein